ncbi:uncharacterized protein LOC117332180 [Pecten maximus]|uniref:uncharacterized protein LOC117332180 n=1 Tax=Pecten maximus TaxID=6579 RepID=UPI0014582311|nr:uncharacterized protein LOC117332180 [Pecten maximus]
MMDLTQPLYVDCSVEYDLDMTRFPGWDDPRARAQTALLLHLPGHESCLCYHGCPSPEDELQTILREFSTTEDQLQEIIEEFCLDMESSEDELSSFVDDVLGSTDGLLMMSDAVSSPDSDNFKSPDTALSSTDTTFIDETWPDFLWGSYIIDQMSPSLDSSSSSAHLPIVDFDFLLCSPHQGSERPYRKRKNSGELDHRPSAKRPCYHGDALLSEVYSTFTATNDFNSFENEMRYGLSVCVRD